MITVDRVREFRQVYYRVDIQRVAKGVYLLECSMSQNQQIYRGDMGRLKPPLREHFARHVEDQKCYLPNAPDQGILW